MKCGRTPLSVGFDSELSRFGSEPVELDGTGGVGISALQYAKFLGAEVRIGEQPDSAMTATRVGSIRTVLCGSPRLFETKGLLIATENWPSVSTENWL